MAIYKPDLTVKVSNYFNIMYSNENKQVVLTHALSKKKGGVIARLNERKQVVFNNFNDSEHVPTKVVAFIEYNSDHIINFLRKG